MSHNMAAILQLISSFIAYIYNIGHLCYGQLTPLETRYALTSITWPYHGLRIRDYQGNMFFFFFKLTADKILAGFWLDSNPNHYQGYLVIIRAWLFWITWGGAYFKFWLIGGAPIQRWHLFEASISARKTKQVNLAWASTDGQNAPMRFWEFSAQRME